MYVITCVCVSMCVFMCVCIYVFMYLGVCIYLSVYMYVCARGVCRCRAGVLPPCVWVYGCVHICVYVCYPSISPCVVCVCAHACVRA